MEDFKREDYIYLRYLEDDKDTNKKKGDIVRYKKDWLIERLNGRRFNTCFNSDSLIREKNPDADENEVEFNKIYKSITVSDNWRGAGMEPTGIYDLPADDVQLADHILRIKEKMTRILADNTGRTYEEIARDTDRDNYLTAEEALHYGLIDKVYFKR